MKGLVRVLFFLLLQINFFMGNLFAQSDSLLDEFKKTPKTASNILKLIDLSYNLTDYNVDSALDCAEQIMQISSLSSNYELRCKILINIGAISKLSGKYKEANKYLFQALRIAEKNNLISSKIISLYQIGDLNRCIGLLDQSLYYLYLSKNIALENNHAQHYPGLYDRISSTFYQLTEHNYPAFKLTKIPFQNEFSLEKGTIDDFIKLSKIYADSALLISNLNNDNRTKLSSLNILGAYYRHQKNYHKAIDYFNKAIELATQTNFRKDLPNYYINIARTYYIQKQYKKAIEFGLKAYQTADDLNILVYKSTSSDILRLSYIEIKDYKNALQFQEIEAGTREEMNSQQNWSKITELDKKYQTERKQKEIEYQKKLLDLNKADLFRKNIIIAIMLIVCILIVTGIYYIKKQNKALVRQKEEIHNQNQVLHAQKEQIKNQYTQLENLNRFKETLVHTFVHDLKNPLSQIMYNSSNQTTMLSARKMMRLITNMLDIEKYECTQLNLNTDVFSLRKLILQIKEEQGLSINEKNLNIKLEFDDCTIIADKDLIKRVFENLLSNAIRFSPQNQNINVWVQSSDNNTLKIGIQNFGEKIPENDLPYIFEKYRQFGKQSGSSHHSTGLGLAFCKMAIEAHNQKIIAQNTEDGVVFLCTLKGEKIISNELNPVITTDCIKLSSKEKVILESYFDRLKKIDVYQVSDIVQVLDDIPEQSKNIRVVKQTILNAVFSGNTILYNQIINQ